MPKQIKKRQITGGEKAACIAAIAGMTIGLIFAVAFIIFIPELENASTSEQLAKSMALAIGYVLFFAGASVSGILSLICRKKSGQAGDLMRGFFSLISAFLSLLAVRFMLALFFSGLGKEDTVDKIIGDNSYSKFIENQAPAFACLVIAMSIMLFVGITAAVKLAKR
ncbi:MAG: hypothetical protein IKP95_05400 [Ruminococcus sp.]|nr:hypothetical protein [Ruminococcus sp.]